MGRGVTRQERSGGRDGWVRVDIPGGRRDAVARARPCAGDGASGIVDRMRTSRSAGAMLAILAAAAGAQQLDALERRFDRRLEDARRAVLREKLVALEELAQGDAADGERARARLAAAELALELEDWEVARNHGLALLGKDPDPALAALARLAAGRAMVQRREAHDGVFAVVMPGVEAARADEPASVGPALELARVMAGYLASSGDKLGAQEVWARVQHKLAAPAIAARVAAEQAAIARIGAEAPEFARADVAGGTVRLADLRGKVVLLDFAAPADAGWLAERRRLQAVHERLHAGGLERVTVWPERAPQTTPAWPSVTDMDGTLAKLYAVAPPAVVLIGRDGRIARVGARGEDLALAAALAVEKRP
jgi:hypothetical protein